MAIKTLIELQFFQPEICYFLLALHEEAERDKWIQRITYGFFIFNLNRFNNEYEEHSKMSECPPHS